MFTNYYLKREDFPKEWQSLHTICSSRSASYKTKMYFLRSERQTLNRTKNKDRNAVQTTAVLHLQKLKLFLFFLRTPKKATTYFIFLLKFQDRVLPFKSQLQYLVLSSNPSYAENWIPGQLYFSCSHQCLTKKMNIACTSKPKRQANTEKSVED